jgi:hypothetical protein
VSAHLTFSLPNIEKRGQSNIQEKDEQTLRGSMQPPKSYKHGFVYFAQYFKLQTSTTNILKTSRTFQFHLAQGMGQRGHDLHAELVQQSVGGQRQQPHALVGAADGQERGLKAALRNRTHVHAPKNIFENKKGYPKS